MSSSHTVAVLGGTFDPVHLGHLAIAEQARDAGGFDETWLIPSALPPHRAAAHAPAEDRLDMLRAAVDARPRLRVLDIEVRRPGPSYTIDTIAELTRTHPDVEAWLILGADAARDIETWHGHAALMRQARFVIVNRSGVAELNDAEARRLGFAPPRTRIIHVDSPPISATAIRQRVAAGEPLDDLVPPAVAELIAARGLYRSADAGDGGGIIGRG